MLRAHRFAVVVAGILMGSWPLDAIALAEAEQQRIGDEPPPALLADPSGFSKCRFISFAIPAGESQVTALRVLMVSLHNVVPPYSGAPTIPFDLFEGQSVWVGPPVRYVESAASNIPFMAARTQCQPHYQDWTTVGLLHVWGSHVVPSSIYHVQQLAVGCQGQEIGCPFASAPLEIHTTRYGDVEAPFNPPSPMSQPDLADIGAVLDKFRGLPGAPIKARATIYVNTPFGEITHSLLSVDLSFIHIDACVNAFRGARNGGQMGKCANSSSPCTNHADCGANGPCNLYCPD